MWNEINASSKNVKGNMIYDLELIPNAFVLCTATCTLRYLNMLHVTCHSLVASCSLKYHAQVKVHVGWFQDSGCSMHRGHLRIATYILMACQVDFIFLRTNCLKGASVKVTSKMFSLKLILWGTKGNEGYWAWLEDSEDCQSAIEWYFLMCPCMVRSCFHSW